jgi:transposase InsO family protein
VLELGWSVPVAAEAQGVSSATAYKWIRRFVAEGEVGLLDRSCRPHRSPRLTSAALTNKILKLRERRWGPHRIGYTLRVAPSTVYAVLCRQDRNRLIDFDRPTGVRIRRYVRERPGELLHVDVKKIGRIPDGGGWRGMGPRKDERFSDTTDHKKRRLGYDYLHIAIDDASRVAFVQVHRDERGPSCGGFLADAVAFFAKAGVRVERVMTDNAWAYTHGRDFQAVLVANAIRHIRIRPRRPQTNGKVERFNRTLLEEWAYERPYTSNTQRLRAFTRWVATYNLRRPHTALKGSTPMAALNNLCGNYN